MQLVNKSLIAFSLALFVSGGTEAYAQIPAQSPSSAEKVPTIDTAKTRQRMVTKTTEPVKNGPKKSPAIEVESEVLVLADEPVAKRADAEKSTTALKPGLETKSAPKQLTGDPAQDNRHETASEEAAIVPYYNNFFNTYRLGPEDIISVSVFGQDRYSRTGITVPPSGRISLALVPGGIFVNGRTVEEVAEAITKKYDEFIIDPQVSVSLDKASSYRYSVVGDVAQPGIRLMNRRLTVTEALSEAGGVLSTGNRSKVVVLRRQANGNLEPIAVNVSAIYKGKAPDTTYLVPGDQILVPGNKLKSLQKIMTFFPVLNFARIFTGGIF